MNLPPGRAPLHIGGLPGAKGCLALSGALLASHSCRSAALLPKADLHGSANGPEAGGVSHECISDRDKFDIAWRALTSEGGPWR